MLSHYLRQGYHSYRITKQQPPTTHYIWRTQGDSNVRESHAKNDGKIFAWDERPETGHPGEDFGCRCTAEPYYPDVKEYAEIKLYDVYDTGPEWDNSSYYPPKNILNGEWYGHIQEIVAQKPSFFQHYFYGDGQPVKLREIGLLEKVVAKYIRDGAIERLKGQIASKARLNIGNFFDYDFLNTYRLIWVKFSLGRSTIKGIYYGKSELTKEGLFIKGRIDFDFIDRFADPYDIGNWIKEDSEDPDGTPYDIADKWYGTYEALVHSDETRSVYFSRKKD